ncbi:BTAD domain-containing putative transcriptional regulator [Actinosynnema sp. NPDC059797]
MKHEDVDYGQALRGSRLRVGLTQRTLAEQAGVSLRTVRHIEQGHVTQPRKNSIRRLADVLERHGESPWTAGGDDIRVGVLGPLEIRRGNRLLSLGSLKQRSFLALLALQPNEVVSREEIVDVLWADRPPGSCLSMVYSFASALRKVITPTCTGTAGPVISRVGGGYRLLADPAGHDSSRFDEQVALAQGTPRNEAGKELYEQALDLWRGGVLADLPLNVRQHPVAVALAGRRVAAASAYADVASLVDRGDDAIDRLRAVAHHDLLHEGVHARLMLALAAAGQRAAALHVFTGIRRRLDEELGIQPGEEIRFAYREVVEGRPVAATRG